MSQENVQKFEELLRSDEDLQAKIRATVEAYAGDKADELAVFEATIGSVAAEAGLPFTYEEGKAYALEGIELSDAELDSVAGGTSACYVVGGGSEPEADSCFSELVEMGDGACAYVGVSLAIWG